MVWSGVQQHDGTGQRPVVAVLLARASPLGPLVRLLSESRYSHDETLITSDYGYSNGPDTGTKDRHNRVHATALPHIATGAYPPLVLFVPLLDSNLPALQNGIQDYI
jgi:hypothetical protein